MLNKLPKTTKPKKRAGRGISAGLGKTAGRGTKGQKSRAGRGVPSRFEGGQTTLFARLPKVKGGVVSHARKVIALNLDQVNALYKDKETVDVKSLIAKGVLRKNETPAIKILSRGELKKNVDLSQCKLSANAAKKITKPKPTQKTNATT